MDKIISSSTDDIPCLKFDPVMPDTVPPKENKIAIHSSQIIRIVGVKLKSYFDHGKILYHKDMNIFCVQDNNLVTTGKYARYFTCSRLDGLFNHISADTFMDRYIEKSNIICICYKALSCTRGKAFLTIAIPLISDFLFHEIRMAYPNDGPLFFLVSLFLSTSFSSLLFIDSVIFKIIAPRMVALILHITKIIIDIVNTHIT